MTTTLANISKARKALEAASSMEDIMAIRDQAEAVRTYAKAAGQGLEAQTFAADIKLRAERKAGDLLAKMNGKQKGRPKKNGPTMGPNLDDLGITKNQSSRWQKEATVPSDTFDQHVSDCTKDGKELTQASVLALAGAGHVSQSVGENEWYTPPEILDLARGTMGGIDLDPASSEAAQGNVNAKRWYSIAEDGLTKKWTGRVWLNPPYSKDLCGKFIGKLVDHFDSGHVKQACVLVNNATETAWAQPLLLACSAVCFPSGRIRFLDKDGKVANSPLQGQMIAYLGDRFAQFDMQFKSLGVVLFGHSK